MKQKFSLRNGLIALVVVCWILPMLVVIAVTVFTVLRNINAQAMQSAAATAYAAAEICIERVDTAIDASRSASYDKTIYRAWRTYLRTGDHLDFYRDVDRFLSRTYKFDNKYMFTSLRFYDKDARLAPLAAMEFYTINESLFPAASHQTGTRAYADFVQQDAAAIMRQAPALGTKIGFLVCGDSLYLFRNMYLDGADPTAVLLMRLDTSRWFDSMASVPWSDGILLSLQNQPIPLQGSLPPLHELQTAYRSTNGSDNRIFPFGEQRFLGGELRRDDYTFFYAVRTNNQTLLAEGNKLRNAAIGMQLLLIPLLAILLRFFYKNVSRPVQLLVNGTREIRDGAFGLQVAQVSPNREFTQLTGAFNDMSAQLKYQFDHIYREELALRDAKIMAMQSQINPHFLGNTLEIINWEARFAGAEKVSRMIEALSTMLDAAMDRSGSPMVSLAQEMMYVDSYLYIIGERLGKRLQVEKEVDQALLHLHVPRLLLQPIIENAVEHGIVPRHQGKITLRIYRREQDLVLEIENDAPMTPEDEARIQQLLTEDEPTGKSSSLKLGIRNVHQRLCILYGPERGLLIESTSIGTTLAKIIIPIDHADNNIQ